MKFENATYTVLDVETTGLYPHWGDKICEIGALKISPDGTQETFDMLIDPKKAISAGAYAVNKISEDMLKGKPQIDEVIDDFMDFIRGSVIVAYNARFDMGFISSALGEKKGQLTGHHVVDALTLARNLFPSMGKYNLSLVAKSLNIDMDTKHRAMADVKTTWQVFKKELDVLKEKGISDVDDVSNVYIADTGATEHADKSIEIQIRNAIVDDAPLKIKYKSIWDNKVSTRTVTPKSIKESYLVAYCHLRKARRNFRLDCILEIAPQSNKS